MNADPDPAAPTPRRSKAVRGILWMLFGSFCFACMHAVIKEVARTGVHPFETAFFRLMFGMLPIIPFFVKDGLAPLKTKRLGLLTLRGVLNSAAMMCYFFALSIAPLAQVTALGFSAPIFASVLAVLFLGETIRLRRWTAILLGVPTRKGGKLAGWFQLAVWTLMLTFCPPVQAAQADALKHPFGSESREAFIDDLSAPQVRHKLMLFDESMVRSEHHVDRLLIGIEILGSSSLARLMSR